MNEYATTARRQPRRVRVAPIIWGVLFLAFCAWTTQQVFFPGTISAETWLIWGVIGIGVLLLIVALIVSLRATVRRDGGNA